MKVQVFHQGQERQQVIVIDDFADDAGALVDAAACETFAAVHAYYPGVRAPVEESYYSGLEQKIGALVCDAFGGDSLTVTGACYSLVTTPPAALQVIQRLPHYDGTDPAQLAILHYLHGPEMGGTAFYRHRATGFESLNDKRLAEYGPVLQREVQRHGLPTADYVRSDTPLFEQIAAHEARFNRVLIYRGNTLHSGMISADMAFSDDPRTGRLTVNTFARLD